MQDMEMFKNKQTSSVICLERCLDVLLEKTVNCSHSLCHLFCKWRQLLFGGLVVSLTGSHTKTPDWKYRRNQRHATMLESCKMFDGEFSEGACDVM